MLALFKAEWSRYQKVTWLVFALHLAFWGYSRYVEPVVQLNGMTRDVFYMLMAFGSLIFGAVQFGQYRNKNRWTWLVHRPVPVSTIHLALSLAGLAILLLTIMVPFMAVMGLQDIFSGELVEARHYLFVFQIFGVVATCYFIGSYIVISPNRGAILTLGLMTLLINRGQYSAMQSILTCLIFALLTGFLAHRAFQVNREQHFERKRDIFTAALVMQPALLGLLLATQALYYHFPLLLLDSHPDQYTTEQKAGTYSVMWGLTSSEEAELVIDPKLYSDKATLVDQMDLAPTGIVRLGNGWPPHRGQMFDKDRGTAIYDESNDRHWVFSHKHMVLVGQDVDTDAVSRYLGVNGFVESLAKLSDADRFPSVPTFYQNRFVKTDDTLYDVDFVNQTMSVKHQLPQGEYYTTRLYQSPDLKLFVLSSDKALYLFDPGQMTAHDLQARAFTVLPHPRAFDRLEHIQGYKLVDGYVLKYMSRGLNGFDKPGVAMYFAGFDGQVIPLGEVAFAKSRQLPVWLSDQTYWFSPLAIGIVWNYIDGLYDPHHRAHYVTTETVLTRVYPGIVYVLALICALLSALATWYLCRRLAIKGSKAQFWIVMNLLLSLPGLASFLLLNRWKHLLPFKRFKPVS